MKSGPGNQRQTGAGRGGTPGLRIYTLLFLNPTLIAVNSYRCGIKSSVSNGLHEPPYTEPYVRWCGRTAEVTSPPTRCAPGRAHSLGSESLLRTRQGESLAGR